MPVKCRKNRKLALFVMWTSSVAWIKELNCVTGVYLSITA